MCILQSFFKLQSLGNIYFCLDYIGFLNYYELKEQ